MQLPQFQAHAAMEEQHWWFLGRREILMTLLSALIPPSKDQLLLDVGCGTGGNTKTLSQEYHCIGIDPAEDAIRFAKQRFPSLEFIQGYAPDDIPEQMNKADAVLLMDVLEHVEHDREFIQNMIKAMRPGAFLILMAPANPTLTSPHDAGFEHFRRYEKHTMRALWKDANAEELLLEYCNSRLYPIVKLVRILNRLRGKSWGSNDTDLSVPPAPLNRLLASIFSAESKVLLDVLQKKRLTGYRRGVSLMAVLKKN
jgi:2-polyprenyl-3-methyl-5-hydroxy-6-metoxy-1,4-benzoquinol methylase